MTAQKLSLQSPEKQGERKVIIFEAKGLLSGGKRLGEIYRYNSSQFLLETLLI